jgi:hypothetical protein
MPRPIQPNETAQLEAYLLRIHYKFDEGGPTQTFTINPARLSGPTAKIVQATDIGVDAAKHVIGCLSSLCSVKQVTAHVRGAPGDGIPSLASPMLAMNNGATPPTFLNAAFNMRNDSFNYQFYTLDAFRSSAWIRGLDDAWIVAGAAISTLFAGFYTLPAASPALPNMSDKINQSFDKWIFWIMYWTCHCRPNPAYNGTTVLTKWLTSPWLYAKFDKVATRKVGLVYGQERGRRRVGA